MQTDSKAPRSSEAYDPLFEQVVDAGRAIFAREGRDSDSESNDEDENDARRETMEAKQQVEEISELGKQDGGEVERGFEEGAEVGGSDVANKLTKRGVQGGDEGITPKDGEGEDDEDGSKMELD